MEVEGGDLHKFSWSLCSRFLSLFCLRTSPTSLAVYSCTRARIFRHASNFAQTVHVALAVNDDDNRFRCSLWLTAAQMDWGTQLPYFGKQPCYHDHVEDVEDIKPERIITKNKISGFVPDSTVGLYESEKCK